MRIVQKLDFWWFTIAPETDACTQAATLEILRKQIDQEPSGFHGWFFCGAGDQVQSVLLKNGMLGDEVLTGETEPYAWIAQRDWVYVCDFDAKPAALGQKQYLRFKGIDTIAEIYLNEVCIGSHDDMYLENHIDVTGKLRETNRLLVYFYSPYKIAKQRETELPEGLKGLFGPAALLRKCSTDFGDFGNVLLTPIGLFDDVVLETTDHAEIVWNDINIRMGERYLSAEVLSAVQCRAECSALTVSLRILDPDGKQVCACADHFAVTKELDRYEVAAVVNAPRLWWPKNYGDQSLYTVITDLYSDGELLDSVSKQVGIRRLEAVGNMRFRVNGRLIKLWGGNIAPFFGLTHRWDAERCTTEIDLIDKMNMNCLRLWGGGMQYGDSLYDECDRRGIMIWQDFYLNWSFHPDLAHYRDLCRREATQIVQRLKHRPCILLWCGGNETLMHNEEGYYEKDWKDVGYKLFRVDFSDICNQLDPERYYHLSSPAGGEYPSDPGEGDTHPLYYTLRHSTWQYPVFVSESARTSIGPLRSIRKFMKPEEIWPEGYVNQITYQNAYNPFVEEYKAARKKNYLTTWKRIPVPRTLWRRAAGFFAAEAGPVEKFYDAHDSQTLVYRINAAYQYFTRKYTEMARRGKPAYDVSGERRVAGTLLWKINDTWPQLYCSLIDYFLEVHIPYYQVKRSFSPVLLSFDLEDHILLWGVNDTLEDIGGKLVIKAFSQASNHVRQEMTLPIWIEAGQSKVLTDLDRISPIFREEVIYAALLKEDGEVIASTTMLMDLERHLVFPEARIDLAQDDGVIIIRTDRFARCVELSGEENGDEFGWYFEDNYFDLLPFEEKRVKIFGRHAKGTITAKAQYSPHVTRMEL